LAEMRDVLYDREFVDSADPAMSIYRVYRDIPIENPLDVPWVHELSYDITVMPPLMLGKEFVKTHGHNHSVGPGGATYAEIYEVLQGTVHVLLQRTGKTGIAEVSLIEGHPSDKIIISPNYGHTLINPSEETLVTGNLISRNCAACYRSWREKKGGAYYELKGGNLVRNPEYGTVPEVCFREPDKRFAINSRLTALLLKNPDEFLFLTDPSRYAGIPVSIASLSDRGR